MSTSDLRKRSVWVFIAFSLCLGAPLGEATAGPPRTREAPPRSPREVPDDPPEPRPRAISGAEATVIQFGPFIHRQVNVAEGGANILLDAANEPSIAVDPLKPNTMAIGWRQFNAVTSNFRQAGWAYTTDGGRTWTFPGVIEPGVFRSDPVLGFDAAGTFFYSSLKVVGGIYSTQLFRSTNGGQTWSVGVEAFGGDKQWITVDRTGGMGNGHIYQAWSVAAGCCGDTTFNRSIDGGLSFSRPVLIPSTPIWGTMAVAADGTLYLAGVDPDDFSVFWVVKSATAKDPLSPVGFDAATPFLMDGNISFGGGTGSPNPGGLLGQVWIGVDRSGGPYHGYLYVLCSVDPPGDDLLDVHFVRSTDGGATWSDPVRINDDPIEQRPWQWFATMSVAPNGRIDVVWNDTRNTWQSNRSELFYAFSADGGTTWSPNRQLSPAWDSYVGWPNQNKIGDYYDMVSDDVGANLAWAATFNNEQDVYYLRIGDYDCNANGVPDSLDIALKHSADFNENGIPDDCEGLQTGAGEMVAGTYQLFQSIPNPFNPTTAIRFEVPAGGGTVRLRVFDVSGRLVRTLVDGAVPGGMRSAAWDGCDDRGAPVASGVYFYRLEAPGYTQTRKTALVK